MWDCFATIRNVIVGDVRGRDGGWMASVIVEEYLREIETLDGLSEAVAFVEDRVGVDADYIRFSPTVLISWKKPGPTA